jgi:hypothetical protein
MTETGWKKKTIMKHKKITSQQGDEKYSRILREKSAAISPPLGWLPGRSPVLPGLELRGADAGATEGLWNKQGAGPVAGPPAAAASGFLQDLQDPACNSYMQDTCMIGGANTVPVRTVPAGNKYRFRSWTRMGVVVVQAEEGQESGSCSTNEALSSGSDLPG